MKKRKKVKIIELEAPDGTTIRYHPKFVEIWDREKFKRVTRFSKSIKWIKEHFQFWVLNPKYLFLKNPCKKCLVNACCSDQITCEKFHEYAAFKGPFETITLAKAYLWTVYVSVMAALVSWVYVFFY